MVIIFIMLSLFIVVAVLSSVPMTKYNCYHGIADEWDMHKLLKMYPNESSND